MISTASDTEMDSIDFDLTLSVRLYSPTLEYTITLKFLDKFNIRWSVNCGTDISVNFPVRNPMVKRSFRGKALCDTHLLGKKFFACKTNDIEFLSIYRH
jgi:hypothetical protein